MISQYLSGTTYKHYKHLIKARSKRKSVRTICKSTLAMTNDSKDEEAQKFSGQTQAYGQKHKYLSVNGLQRQSTNG